MNVQYEIAMKINKLFGKKWEDAKKYTVDESEMRQMWPYLNEKQKKRALANHEFSLNFIREIYDDFIKENWNELLYSNRYYDSCPEAREPFIKEYNLKVKITDARLYHWMVWREE